MLTTVSKSTLVMTAFSALVLAAAPLTNAQSPQPDSPPASTAEAESEQPETQQRVRLEVDGEGYFAGRVHFAPPGTDHGGFVFRGKTHDTNNNATAVYLQVKVAGHAPNEFENPADQDRRWSKAVWDYQATRTDHAEMRLCAEDILGGCSDWKTFNR